ncbi:hypothetical protein FNV43_RR03934 [Rhamnella rubrinervis]|uniref:Aminotransferase-like plant mobile domain-containing protein n=1 Tax=Rhamnella rubrinervis TaxID=2594499 RepID=A0A8K0HKV2_9ROSA|nr:hypothetical protein FNV43_RR03934 [Rhamnella rubrinervis]
MAEIADSIVDERKELMFSFSGDSNPVLRTAHFLKPSVTFTDEPDLELVSLSRSSLPPIFEPREWPLNVEFKGWNCRPFIWRKWVHYMRYIYGAVWKEAGIYDAIMNSTFEIQKDDNLTLETLELKEIEEKLIQARVQAGRSKSSKASQSVWMKMFMGSGSDIEHEAFLVTWLSRFVFANSNLIRKLVFPIAIHLARGTRIALAPAVLASIYRDLTLFKEAIVASTKCNDENTVLGLNLFSPLQLLRLWALERFQGMQPHTNLMRGDPFFARWQRMKKLTLGNVRLALDSAVECFKWRPYTTDRVNWYGSKLFGDKEMWVSVGPSLDELQESFARCLMVSQLVGLDCIEQYLPHRVSMQFGIDQDLPACVVQSNETPEVAWANYSKPIGGKKLYIPSIHFEAGVTNRYMESKKKSLDLQYAIRSSVKRKRNSRSPQEGMKMDKAVQKALKEDEFGDDVADFPPGFPPKCNSVNKAGKSPDIVEPKLVVETISSDDDTLDKRPVCEVVESAISSVKRKRSSRSPQEGTKMDKAVQKALKEDEFGDDVADFPPGFPPKCNSVNKAGKSPEIVEPKLVVETISSDDDTLDKRPVCEVVESAISSVKRKRSSRSPQEGTKMDKAVQKALKVDFGNDIADFPPGFPPKCNSVNKAGKSPEVVEPIVVETISSDDDALDERPVCDGKKVGHSQNSSAFSTGNRAVGLEKLVTESVERTTHNGDSTEGLRRTMDDVHDRNSGNLDYNSVRNNRSETEGCSQRFKILSMEFEERMDRLGIVIAKLQEERLAKQARRV